MQLSLKRPIVFFDLETTGINVVNDRIVELSYLKVFPDGEEEQKVMRFNPGREIPAEATAVHGITNDDVKNKPLFKDYAKTFAQILEGCDIAGFNSNKFDVPMLAEEFLRADVDFDFRRHKMVDVQVIFHKMERRTLSAAYKFYCGQELVGAHGAAADTRATYEVLKAQLDRYQDAEYEENKRVSKPIVNDIDALSAFSSHNRDVDFAGRIIYNDKNQEVFNFGKHKGKLVSEVLAVEPSYYSWMMNGEFALDTKRVMTQLKMKYSGK